MGQAAQLIAASADLRGASSRYIGAAAELETMVGTMAGVVHGLISEWKGLGSEGFVTAWQAAARDAFRAIDALGGTGGAMGQLANTIDDNIAPISHAESMEQQVSHGPNFGQRLSTAESQGAQALSAIQSKASSLVGQLQSAVVPLTIGACSTGSEPLPPGGFDGVDVLPQVSGPKGPGGLPPGLVSLMGKGGEGGGAGKGGSSHLLHFLTSIGMAGYETWPDFKKEGYLSSKAWEHFAINFTTTYAETEEGSGMGELARLSALKAVLQTMPDIQQQTRDKKFDSTSILYSLAYHTGANFTLDGLGDRYVKPTIGDSGNIVVGGLTGQQLDKLAATPKDLKETLDAIMKSLPKLPANDTNIPTPTPGPAPIAPGTTSPKPKKQPISHPTPWVTP